MISVSMIVPCYGVEKYMEQCMKSLVTQSLQDVQLIFVDDESPDGCPRILDRWAEKDSRIHVIHQKNTGVAGARNNGLAAARGEYVCFLDGDDWLADDSLEVLYKSARSTADVVLGDYSIRSGEEKKRMHSFLKEFHVEVGVDCIVPVTRGSSSQAHPLAMLIRRDFLMRHKILFDMQLKGRFDDALFAYQVICAATKVAYTNTDFYQYRVVKGSLSHSFNKQILRIGQIYNEKRKNALSGRYHEKSYLKYYNRMLLRLISFWLNKAWEATGNYSGGQEVILFLAASPEQKELMSQPYGGLTLSDKLKLFLLKRKMYHTFYDIIRLKNFLGK